MISVTGPEDPMESPCQTSGAAGWSNFSTHTARSVPPPPPKERLIVNNDHPRDGRFASCSELGVFALCVPACPLGHWGGKERVRFVK